MFLLHGPNTNGVNTIFFILEAQAHHIVRALEMMTRRRLASVEVPRELMERYDQEIQAAMRGTAWVAGCSDHFRSGPERS